MPLQPRSRWSPLAAAALLGVLLVACGDPFEIKATVNVLEDTLVVNSISDASAPIAAPTTIDIADQPTVFATSRRPVARRVGPEFYETGAGFDVAIDIRGDSVVFVPPRLVATALSTVRRIGLRRDTVPFDSIKVAAGGGYAFDTVRVAARVGQTVTIVSQHPACRGEISRVELYAKVGVMAIDPATRTATLRVRLDPNCGFRSFLPGVPRR